MNEYLFVYVIDAQLHGVFQGWNDIVSILHIKFTSFFKLPCARQIPQVLKIANQVQPISSTRCGPTSTFSHNFAFTQFHPFIYHQTVSHLEIKSTLLYGSFCSCLSIIFVNTKLLTQVKYLFVKNYT